MAEWLKTPIGSGWQVDHLIEELTIEAPRAFIDMTPVIKEPRGVDIL